MARSSDKVSTDAFEAIVDPLSTTTKRWISVLWAVAVLAFLIAEGGFKELTVSPFGVLSLVIPAGRTREICVYALVAVNAVTFALVLSDFAIAWYRWDMARKKAAGDVDPRPQKFTEYIREPVVRAGVILPILIHLVVGWGALLAVVGRG